ncbi:hypothetical protein LINPERHAP2_LOCUS41029 [Linum perenne]
MVDGLPTGRNHPTWKDPTGCIRDFPDNGGRNHPTGKDPTDALGTSQIMEMEELNIRSDRDTTSIEQSSIRGIEHLIDNDDRTSDEEFNASMGYIAVRQRRRRVGTREDISGEEVEKLSVFESDVVISSSSKEDDQPDEEACTIPRDGPCSPSPEEYESNHSSYRGSEDSDHVRGNLSDDQNEEDKYSRGTIYDSSCDHGINLKLEVSHIVAGMKLKYGLELNPRQCYRAKVEARKLLTGTLESEYMKIRSYIAELQRVDLEDKFIVEVDTVDSKDFIYFKRIFVNFSSLRKGFLQGCRPMFGLDECFLKGEVTGMILSVVGKDDNNQMYPIAWAVIEGGNKALWAWFL